MKLHPTQNNVVKSGNFEESNFSIEPSAKAFFILSVLGFEVGIGFSHSKRGWLGEQSIALFLVVLLHVSLMLGSEGFFLWVHVQI